MHPDIQSVDVAEALNIHPIMLYRWRSKMRTGKRKDNDQEAHSISELQATSRPLGFYIGSREYWKQLFSALLLPSLVDTFDTSKRFRFGFTSGILKRMNKGLVRVFWATVVGCLLWVQMTGAFAQSRVEIDVSHNLVTIDADQVDLKLVLEELALLSDFKLWMPQNLSAQKISLRVEKQTLKNTLLKLLADTSYALVYDDNNSVSAIYVLARGEAQPAGPLALDLSGINRHLFMDATQSDPLTDSVNEMLGNLSDLNSELLLQTIPQKESGLSVATPLDDVIEQLQQLQLTLPETLIQPAAAVEVR